MIRRYTSQSAQGLLQFDHVLNRNLLSNHWLDNRLALVGLGKLVHRES